MLILGASSGGGYEIANSVIFRRNDTTHLIRTPGSEGNRKTWTFSTWVKRRSSLSNEQHTLFSCQTANTDNDRITIFLAATSKVFAINGSATAFRQTSQQIRDPSAWYNLIVAMDTTQAVANDRVKMYINGLEVTEFDIFNNPVLNSDTGINQAAAHAIGTQQPSQTNSHDGQMAETVFIDGLQLTADDFGEFNSANIWIPKKVSGLSFGAKGFFLDYEDNSTANALGTDVSGNGNDFTASSLATTDQTVDSPTHNYCALNPLIDVVNYGFSGFSPSPVVGALSEGNLVVTNGANNDSPIALGTIPFSSGKFYAEVLQTVSSYVTGDNVYGILDINKNTSNFSVYRDNANYAIDGSNVGVLGTGFVSGDIIGIAVDADNNTIEWFVNNVSMGSAVSYTAGSVVFAGSPRGNFVTSTVVWNFGQKDFTYNPPAGFIALQTQHLPTPVILNPDVHFNIVLYTGNGTASTGITGVGFSPDFTWIKNRDQADEHKLLDIVRGATKELNSDSQNIESTDVNGLTSFDGDGFTLGTGAGGYNDNAEDFVAWNWKQSAIAGFDIVAYVGNDTSNRNIAHSLGVVPELIIIKDLDTAGKDWVVHHKVVVLGKFLRLNTTNGEVTGAGRFDNASSASNFNIGSASDVNGLNADYIAYLFASIEGYSKIGSYIGNGSTNGPFIYCGFKPAFLLVKRVDAQSSWQIYDNVRDIHNVVTTTLQANSTLPDGSGSTDFDFLSNGFKPRRAATVFNTNGGTHLFIAFAESPFGGRNIAPVTAR